MLSAIKRIEMRTSLLTGICILFFALSCSNNKATNNNLSNEDSSGTSTVESALAPETYKSRNYDEIGFELMDIESVGDIKIGIRAKKVLNLLGEPDEKTEAEIWGADGKTHQTWYFKAKGIELDLIGEENNDQVVGSIIVKEPCKLQTTRQIGIGSTFEEVQKAYTKAIDPNTIDPELLVAGSIYGGISFYFENEKVKQIFIGSSAE